MTKHLPGPWDLAWKDGKHGVVAKVLEGQTAQFVCFIGNYDDDPEKNAIRKANAQLIASAPELLAACETARQLASICSDWNLDEVEINGEMVSIYDVMAIFNEVIAKAKGD